MSASWTDELSELRVSSVLARNVREFGKKHLIDGRLETCWNSDQGSPQWILIRFRRPVRVDSLLLQFQGGFAGRTCTIECSQADDESDKSGSIVSIPFHPEDTNKEQTFPVLRGHSTAYGEYRFVFEESTDFYGRITVYKLDLTLSEG